MAEMEREGDQEMSDVGGKVPGASVVGPASRPALDVNTDVNQGADKSTSSNQPTDNITASDPLMDVNPLSRELTDVITAGDQLADRERVADSNTDNESGDIPDFSLLPLLLWVKIFVFLNPRDRLVLSVTCRKLYGVCRDSSVLWRSIFINMADDEVAKMKTTDKSILRAHSRQMQKLVIHMMCFLSLKIQKSSYRVLSKAARTHQLKHLEVVNTIRGHIGTDMKIRRKRYFLHTFVTSPKASQLCRLKIQAFDWYTHGKSGVMEALKNSSFTSSLTHLYLDLLLDRSGKICKALKRFENLQYLTVPLNCFTNSLLNNLSKHMKEVHFIVYILDRPMEVINCPQVLTRLPQLRLGLIFVESPPSFSNQIISFVQRFLPISFIRTEDVFLMCDSIHLTFLQLVSSSCAHLKVLQCRYNESLGTKEHQCGQHKPCGRLEDMLIKIVSQCPSLDHLEYSGSIYSEAVLTVAAMRKWRVLEFYVKSIAFCKGIHDREKNLQTLCKEVSRILGRTWRLRLHNDPVSH